MIGGTRLDDPSERSHHSGVSPMKDDPFGPWATALSAPNVARLSTFWSRRMALLPQLDRGLPALSRRGRCVLVVLAMTALSMPSLRGTSAAPQDGGNRELSQDAVKEPAKVDDEERALKAFLDVYRLEPGQNLKHVPPPRPEGIRVWLERQRPGRDNSLDKVPAMTFAWRDPDHLKQGVSLHANDATAGWPLRDLPRWTNMDIYPVEIEGEPELLKTEIGGDWIVREGVPADRLVDSLAAILQRALRRRITASLRQVERDVVVVRGRYHYSPLPGRSDDEIEIYGKSLADRGTGGGGSGKFPDFLKWVGEWIERPILNEVDAPPKANVGWHYNARRPFTEPMRREDHDEALVLQHLQEQTGLTFARERKPIRVLFIERAK
jgi:hypothetical protein